MLERLVQDHADASLNGSVAGPGLKTASVENAHGRRRPRVFSYKLALFTTDVAGALGAAAICHRPLNLISAGLLKGKHATCYRSVAEALKEAGALYEDRGVVIDGNLVTSGNPLIFTRSCARP
jgi:hypothetical protein